METSLTKTTLAQKLSDLCSKTCLTFWKKKKTLFKPLADCKLKRLTPISHHMPLWAPAPAEEINRGESNVVVAAVSLTWAASLFIF